MTNREKINQMSNGDLAGLFCEAMEKISEKVDIDMCEFCPVRDMCFKGSNGFLRWLDMEAAEDKKPLPWNKPRLVDKIRGMFVTELADFLSDVEPIPHRVDRYVCRKCKKEHGGKCPCNDGDCLYGSYTESDLTREWLLQEVEECG